MCYACGSSHKRHLSESCGSKEWHIKLRAECVDCEARKEWNMSCSVHKALYETRDVRCCLRLGRQFRTDEEQTDEILYCDFVILLV